METKQMQANAGNKKNREGKNMANIKLGLAPTRRSIFSAPAAVEYANLTRARLRQIGVEFVDIDDIAEDGLLHDDNDRIRIAEKFKIGRAHV